MPSYITKLLTTWESIDSLLDDWQTLLSQSRADTIYMTPEWMSAWRSASVVDAQPYVVTATDENGQLVGIAPFYVSRMKLFGAIPLRVLRPIGDVNSGAEYPDWIVRESERSELLKALADGLSSGPTSWDIAWVPRIAPGASADIVKACKSAGLDVLHRDSEFSGISLGDSLDDFESGFSRSARSRMRRNNRQIAKIDGLQFARCESESDLPIYLDALFELHQLRWKSVGRDGLFVRKPKERAFYESFAPVAFSNGWLGVYALFVNGDIKAVQFGYQYGNVFSQLQEGFDPEFDSGAGNALRHHVIADLIDRGIRYYDFLGGWSEHKRRWGAELCNGSDMLIGKKTLRSSVITSVPLWPSGRFISDVSA